MSNHFKCWMKWLCLLVLTSAVATAEEPELSFKLELQTAHEGFDGRSCWVHARAGSVPAGIPGNEQQQPLIVMTMQKLLLSGSDVFYALNETRSPDLGKTWTRPVEQANFARQQVQTDAPLPTGAHIAPHFLQPGDETTVCDFTPQWHAHTQTLLGTGHTVWYRENRVLHARPRGLAYAVYDLPENRWLPWNIVELPDEPRFQNAGAGSGQRYDLDNGDVLIAIYHMAPGEKQYSVTVLRCSFDGTELRYQEHGNSLTVNNKRGLYEPSLTRFRGKYYLTMRNDDHGYVSVSEDGLNYGPPLQWTFDDGSDLGNYNTQQHWVTHPEGLFLVYTRRGADNDHVFRHRAPLFIGRVDPDQTHVIRETEQILVPERGARLGNFGVCEVSPKETWVTAAEWMQPVGVEKHGSNNRIWLARLLWNRENNHAAGENIK